MFFFPVKLFDTNINRLWLISFIFDSSLLLEAKGKSYKEETLIKQQIKAVWALWVFFFFHFFSFLIFHFSPPLTQDTSFIGISITTLFLFEKNSSFCYFLPFEMSPIPGLDKLNGEIMLWSTRVRIHILWDKNSFPPHSGKYSSQGAGRYLLLALPWTKV